MFRPEPAAPFREPWQAQAFALAVALLDRGVIRAAEWADALGRQVNAPGAAPDGHDYYEHWLNALTALLEAKRIAGAVEIEALAAAWQRAAHATVHGQPIRLENDPMRVA